MLTERLRTTKVRKCTLPKGSKAEGAPVEDTALLGSRRRSASRGRRARGFGEAGSPSSRQGESPCPARREAERGQLQGGCVGRREADP